jgi:uncharacterized membrane protein YqjE
MADERDGDPPRMHFSDAAARVADSAFALLRTRAELAAVEFAEERERLKRSAMMLAGAVFMLSFTLLGVAAWIVVYYWDTHRLEAIAAVTLGFAAIGAGLLWGNIVRHREAPAPFSATLAEFEKDREWLAKRPDHRGAE